MPNNKIQVDLTPPTSTNGWQMSVDHQPPQGSPYPHIIVPVGNKADITFTIQNGANQNVTFTSDPILVAPKDKFDQPSGNGQSFTITDHNIKKIEVPYALVFNGAQKIDPIIDNNGGGNIPIYSSIHFIALIAALFVGFIVGLYVQKKFRLFR